MVEYHKIVKNSRFVVKGNMKDPLFRNAIINQSRLLKKQVLDDGVKDRIDEIFIMNVDMLVAELEGFDLKDYSKLEVYHLQRFQTRQHNCEDKIFGLLDFDWVGWSPETIAKDISVAIEYCCASKHNTFRFDPKLTRAFIMEYKRHLSISRTEISAIPLLISAHYVDLFNYTYSLLKKKDSKAANLDIEGMAEAALWYSKNAGYISGCLSA